MKVIAFVGMPASGKSEAASIIINSNALGINMGDIVREEIKKQGVEPTDSNLGKLATDLRKKNGMDFIAKQCVEKIKNNMANNIVIDGIRGIDEIEYFKKSLADDFTLIFINTPLKLRFERIQKRKRSDDTMKTIEDLCTRDNREIGWGLDKAMDIADIVIENTASLDELKQKMQKLNIF